MKNGLVLGSWFLVLGSWFLVLGSWFLVLGSWFLVLRRGSVLILLKAFCGNCRYWLQAIDFIAVLKSYPNPAFWSSTVLEHYLSCGWLSPNHKDTNDRVEVSFVTAKDQFQWTLIPLNDRVTSCLQWVSRPGQGWLVSKAVLFWAKFRSFFILNSSFFILNSSFLEPCHFGFDRFHALGTDAVWKLSPSMFVKIDF